MENMKMLQLDAAHRQHEVKNSNNNSFIDVLAVLLIGGIGMFLALLGVYLDNLGFLIAGWVIIGISIGIGLTKLGKAINEYIISCIDLKEHLRSRNKDQ